MNEAGGSAEARTPAERCGASDGSSPRPLAVLDVIMDTLDEELFLFSTHSRQGFRLNETGAAIWALCDGTATEEEIACQFAAAYGLAYRRSLAEVRVCLADLAEAGLLTYEGDGAESQAERARHAVLERRALRFRALAE
jgi:hypothetical protein